MKTTLIILGFLLLFATELLSVYFIMPFPGSQKHDTLPIAYWIVSNIVWLRAVGLLLVVLPAIADWRKMGACRFVILFFGLLYAVVAYMVIFRFRADHMFYQPSTKTFAGGPANRIGDDKLIIGVELGGAAKAYPIQLIGYHHQVRDTVGGVPVMVTYCTVCRTGRVFSPILDGKEQTFRLVGMDHFNAMFEDAATHSWWRQATGEAVAGPMKGRTLTELSSAQMTLAAWKTLHPAGLIMQPDTIYKKDYDDLAKYDLGTVRSRLEKRDSASWKPKSWVIGIKMGTAARAYDWNELVRAHSIEDKLAATPLLITLDPDGKTFHVFSRAAGGQQQPVQAYQEFWHSWQAFHPATTRFPH